MASNGRSVVRPASKKCVDINLIGACQTAGARAEYHDPFITAIPVTRAYPELAGRTSQPLDAATVADFDAVLIATDHDDMDWAGLVGNAKLVVDTRNVCQRNGLSAPHVVKA